MKKIKHDHKGTKLLKLGIFASMMLAPLLAIAFKCAYVTFNKNAKDSYSGDNDINTEVIQVTENDNLDSTNTFVLLNNPDNLNPNNYTGTTYYLENVNVVYLSGNATYFTPTMTIRMYNDGVNKWAVTNSNNQTSYINVSSFTCEIHFNFTNNVTRYSTNFINNLYKLEINNNTYLDNAFYYAVDEMKNNELFNWTTTTALYTPTAAMTNGMGITTNTVPILITYWLYLTAIYIVIDIVVELFTALTHMITSRIE